MSEIDIFKKMLEAEERRKRREKSLVNVIEIRKVLPCLTTPGYIRFEAMADREIGEVIPLIFLQFPLGRSHYNPAEGTLTLNIYNRMITLHPDGRVAVTNTRDLEEAGEVLEKIKSFINKAYSTYLRTGPPGEDAVEAAMKISWMDIYQHLPKTNCGECGYPTCQALALKALLGEAKLSQCPRLTEAKYLSSRNGLKRDLGPFLAKTLGLDI
ncbi:MAG: (Fe-S)-binding protein [Candidatus Bathyarchaeia archaeon]